MFNRYINVFRQFDVLALRLVKEVNLKNISFTSHTILHGNDRNILMRCSNPINIDQHKVLLCGGKWSWYKCRTKSVNSELGAGPSVEGEICVYTPHSQLYVVCG